MTVDIIVMSQASGKQIYNVYLNKPTSFFLFRHLSVVCDLPESILA
jgi:hypothetical protein